MINIHERMSHPWSVVGPNCCGVRESWVGVKGLHDASLRHTTREYDRYLTSHHKTLINTPGERFASSRISRQAVREQRRRSTCQIGARVNQRLAAASLTRRRLPVKFHRAGRTVSLSVLSSVYRVRVSVRRAGVTSNAG